MQKSILFFCLFFFSIFYSQNKITGRITDEFNKALEESHIHISSQATNSKKDGTYQFIAIPNGDSRIIISHIGYKEIDTIIEIKKSRELNFKLKEKKEQLEEVFIKHKGNHFSHSILEQKIKESSIDKYSNQSLANVLKEVSGVSVLKSGNSIAKPIINGLHSSRVSIFNTNIKIEDQQWGIEHAPNLDVNAAGKITVIKGASGLQYSGESIGGIVIIEPLVVNKDSLFGKTIFTTESNGRGGSLSTSLHKSSVYRWSWNIQSSLKYYGDKESPDYILSNSGNRELNFSGGLNYKAKKFYFSSYYSLYTANIAILSASHIGNTTDLYYSINNKQPWIIKNFSYFIENPRQKIQHHLAKMNFKYFLKENQNISFQYAFQFNNRKEFDLRTGVPDTKAALDLDLDSHNFNLDYNFSNLKLDFKWGVSALVQNNFANPDTDIRPLIPIYEKFDTGVYAIFDRHFSTNFSLETGIRYDFSTIEASKFYLKSRWNKSGYSPKFDSYIVQNFDEKSQWFTKPSFTFHNLSASIGLQYSFAANLDWYFNISRAVRNPNPSELFSDGLHHSSGMIELGNLNLKQETAIKISTSLQKKWKMLKIIINPFLNHIKNYMFLKPTGSEKTIRGAFPVWEYNQTKAVLMGLDFNSEWKINQHWLYTAIISYVNGKDRTRKEALIDMPPLNSIHRMIYNKKEWLNLNLGLEGEFVFRQTQYPNTNFETNIIINGNQVPVEVGISTPPEAYTLLHFSSDIQFKIRTNSMATLGFSITNLLNTKYRNYLNRQRFFADEIGRNFQIQLKINY